ncbi:uncharacterized protein LOC134221735 [Armigeres subalbatus]|uniref:uncharacterized protein LOC134221735 n=1 Tax=Armigeres subalbatus TaxID=124917 RepID=UPI002ED1721D
MVSPEDVRLMTIKRGQVKAKLTRIFNALNAASQRNVRPSLPQLRVYTKQMGVIYQEYNDIHDMVVASVPEENVTEQEAKYVEFESQYNETSTMIETMTEVTEKENRVPIQTTAVQGGPQQVIVQPQSFRAPLPSFDGKYESWPRFKAMFLDLMRHSTDSDAVKLYHLENSLKGNAAGVIDLETLQNNNYQRAWDILEERFGNKRLILESHILGILNMKKMLKKSSKDLRNLVDECTRHVDNLVKLNQPLSGISELLVVTVLTRALDDQTRELWEASISQTELPEYESTIEFLKQRCVILERCEKVVSVPSHAKFSNQKIHVPPKSVPPKTSHAASVPTDYVCDFCSGHHQNYKCSVFLKMNVDQRQAKLKEANLCFNCLRKGHRSAGCSSDKSCSKCSKKHHTLVHFEQQKATVQSTNTAKHHEVNQAVASFEEPVSSSCSSTSIPPGNA